MRKDAWLKAIGTRRGAPRIFLDGMQAARAGFAPGDKFEVEVAGSRVVISRNVDGSRTVCGRKKGENPHPVIDINSKELLSMFEGMDSIRVIVKDGSIHLLPLASEIKKIERFKRVTGKIVEGKPLSMGSISHGGGVLSHAIHKGLTEAGMVAELRFINEIREDLVDQAMEANDAWSESTSALVMPMQELAQDEWLMNSLGKIDILEMGLPCSGASRAGATKRDIQMMEQHPDVGHLVFAGLMILDKTQPGVVIFENVPDYALTASAQILRQQLRDMGYDCKEAILEGKDFGCMENRVRWCLVACTRGIDFDFENLAPAVRVVRVLGEFLDADIRSDNPKWKEYQGLKVKAVRDSADGKGFKMQIVAADSTSIPTLRKGYHKSGSTDPLLRHPTNPDLLRLLTAKEHARVKGVPPELIDGLSETIAHQLLGQGIVYAPFEAVGRRVGEAIIAAASEFHDRQIVGEEQRNRQIGIG